MHTIVKSKVLFILRAEISSFVLYSCCYYLFKTYKHITRFLICFVSLHAYLIIINAKKMSGVRIGSLNAGVLLSDWNDFGWALNVALPFIIYLVVTSKNKIQMILFSALLPLFLFGIVKTGSRGAFLACISGFLYLAISSKKKVLISVLAILSIIIGIIYAPQTYIDRIETIRNPTDNSALHRIVAWRAAIQMAIDHPLGVGAGNFNSAYGRFYKEKFAKNIHYQPDRWISPHSIYFSVIGEYGFPGLIVLLSILAVNYRNNTKIIKHVDEAKIQKDNGYYLLIAINMSLVAFSVGGIFLGGVNYPHIYLITFLGLATREIILKKNEEQQINNDNTQGQVA